MNLSHKNIIFRDLSLIFNYVGKCMGEGGQVHLRAGGPWRPEALVSSRDELHVVMSPLVLAQAIELGSSVRTMCALYCRTSSPAPPLCFATPY